MQKKKKVAQTKIAICKEKFFVFYGQIADNMASGRSKKKRERNKKKLFIEYWLNMEQNSKQKNEKKRKMKLFCCNSLFGSTDQEFA